MYGPCEKCAPGDPWSWALPLTLIGGYRTKLCDRHANEWREFIDDSIASRDLDEADVGVGCYISQGNFDDAMSYQRAKRKIEREFYDIAKTWCQEPEPVPQEADKPAPHLAVLTYDQPDGPSIATKSVTEDELDRAIEQLRADIVTLR